MRLQANKFLPYGFGPGRKTVIEDAASFDDDEEDYGDYQVSFPPLSSLSLSMYWILILIVCKTDDVIRNFGSLPCALSSVHARCASLS